MHQPRLNVRPPRTGLACTAMLLALCSAGASAQTVYRIVGPDGKVSFSDRPPPPAASPTAPAPKTSVAGANARTTAGSPSLPYELQQVARQFPVTLYTASDCVPCTSARNLLQSRGVPFAERTISTNEDIDALKRISGEGNLPFGTIGGQQLKGYSDVEWTQYLDAAGYPKTSQLPANYRGAAPSPLVAARPLDTPAAPPPAAVPSPAQASDAPRNTPSGSNPAGIQF